MKIKLFTLAAGPFGVLRPGSVEDVAPALAEALIAGGYAERVDPPVPFPLTVIESAVAPAAPEAAVMPRRPGRPRRPL